MSNDPKPVQKTSKGARETESSSPVIQVTDSFDTTSTDRCGSRIRTRIRFYFPPDFSLSGQNPCERAEPTGHPVEARRTKITTSKKTMEECARPCVAVCVLCPYLGGRCCRGGSRAGPRRGAAATRRAGVPSAASTAAAAAASFGSSLGLEPRTGPVFPHHSSKGTAFSFLVFSWLQRQAPAALSRSGRTEGRSVCPHSARSNPAQLQITGGGAVRVRGGVCGCSACVLGWLVVSPKIPLIRQTLTRYFPHNFRSFVRHDRGAAFNLLIPFNLPPGRHFKFISEARLTVSSRQKHDNSRRYGAIITFKLC